MGIHLSIFEGNMFHQQVKLLLLLALTFFVKAEEPRYEEVLLDRKGQCKDWTSAEKCNKILEDGMCDVKYYCWKCAKTCGQCESTDGICSGTSDTCDLAACDDYCFDWKSEEYCAEILASGGCDNKHKCGKCAKTCGKCHGQCWNSGSGSDGTCKDKWNKCEKYAKNCAKTCGKC